MKLDITYKQLSFLRELLNKESDRIFKEKMEICKEKGFQQISIIQKHFKGITNNFCQEGICHTILLKIDSIEDAIQDSLKD